VQGHLGWHPVGKLAQGAGARDGVLLPAERPDDEIAGLEARVVALDRFADGLRRHHLADLDRLRVGARGAHATALIWVDRRPEDADEHLARARLRHRRLDELEVLLARKARRPRCQRHRAV